MTLDWRVYENFLWERAQQTPMNLEQRTVTEEISAVILQLAPADRATTWGLASPPGRFAATVISVSPGVRHAYTEKAAACDIAQIGVKIFKPNNDARRQAQQILPFHNEKIHRLPGLPNEHIQKSLGGGVHKGGFDLHTSYIIQEWVAGQTLEDLLHRAWVATPPNSMCVQSILEQLFLEIIIPLWSEGTVWWDIRDANYCWDTTSQTLKLIDVDSLAAYADEILQTPEVWERRHKGRKTALARLRQMTLRLLLALQPTSKTKARSAWEDAWHAEIEPALKELGCDRQRKVELCERATQSVRKTFDTVFQ